MILSRKAFFLHVLFGAKVKLFFAFKVFPKCHVMNGILDRMVYGRLSQKKTKPNKKSTG